MLKIFYDEEVQAADLMQILFVMVMSTSHNKLKWKVDRVLEYLTFDPEEEQVSLEDINYIFTMAYKLLARMCDLKISNCQA